MTIKELIKRLQAVTNQDRDISIVVGNEDENSMDTREFELHHVEDEDHPLELFVSEDVKQYL